MKAGIAASALLLGVVSGTPSFAAMVTPAFTTGTVTSQTETTTRVTESIRQIDYQTGTSYTVTGTNINIPSVPAPGATYTQVVPGAPFQFSESFFGAGLTRETFIDRETTIDSVTNSTSVFTQ